MSIFGTICFRPWIRYWKRTEILKRRWVVGASKLLRQPMLTPFYLTVAVVCAMYTPLVAGETAFDMKYGALVTWTDAGAPLGKFLLIRHGKDACALRFTEYHQGGDAKPGGIVSSGEESMYAEYDWFYQGDGSSNFWKSNVKYGHKKLVKKPLYGIGRFSFQTGTTDVTCGPLRLGWTYPTRVNFYIGSLRDNEVQLAPTRWEDIKQGDFLSPTIRWYTLDENRQITYIPVDRLNQNQ